MAILDAAPFQNWIAAFDHWERAERRYEAAARMGKPALTDYLRADRDKAARNLNDALRNIDA